MSKLFTYALIMDRRFCHSGPNWGVSNQGQIGTCHHCGDFGGQSSNILLCLMNWYLIITLFTSWTSSLGHSKSNISISASKAGFWGSKSCHIWSMRESSMMPSSFSLLHLFFCVAHYNRYVIFDKKLLSQLWHNVSYSVYFTDPVSGITLFSGIFFFLQNFTLMWADACSFITYYWLCYCNVISINFHTVFSITEFSHEKYGNKTNCHCFRSW